MKRSEAVTLSVLASLLAAACSIPVPTGIEMEISGIPENQAAVSLGTFKTVIVDRGRGRADLNIVIGTQTFTGQMQTIDESVTTTGRTTSTSQAASVGVSGQTVAAAQTAANRQSLSTQTIAQGSSKGTANAVSDKGVTMKCDYVVNNKQFSGSGTCDLSTGARYRMYAKPLNVLMSDGSRRAM